MIAKKNPKVDLEKKRFAFFQIGLILSGSLCLAAFEYSTVNPKEEILSQNTFCELGTTEDPPTEIEIEKPTIKFVATKIIDDVTPTPDPIVDPSPIVDPVVDPIIVVDPVGIGGLVDGTGTGELKPEPIIEYPDIEPIFPGGPVEMASYINKSIELPNYIPDYDQGTVYVSFVVNKDGSIQDVKILRGLSNELNKAAIAVVKSMPNWTPGESNGKPVRVRFTLPIAIKLR